VYAKWLGLLCGTKAELRQFAAMLTRVNVGKSFEQVNYCKKHFWRIGKWGRQWHKMPFIKINNLGTIIF
jgi:hypothetical protein